MNFSWMLGPLGKTFDYFKKRRLERDQKLELIRLVVEAYKTEVYGYTSTLMQHQQPPYRIARDINGHHRQMNEYLNSQIFWKFWCAGEYNEKLREINDGYEELTQNHNSISDFQSKADFLIGRIDRLTSEIRHLIGN